MTTPRTTRALITVPAALCLLGVAACGGGSSTKATGTPSSSPSDTMGATASGSPEATDLATPLGAGGTAPPFPKAAVHTALEAPVTEEQGGVYTAAIPRDDLRMTRGGVRVVPSFDQDSEIDFLPQSGSTALVLGELAATQAEQVRLVPTLLAEGIDVTAVHNHLTQLTPPLQWIHFSAQGSAVTIAREIRTALQRTTRTPFPVSEGTKTTTLPTSALASTLGGQPMVEDKGVVQVSLDRGDQIRMGGTELPSAMGVGALVYFEPMGAGRAATTGEACLLASEVKPVLASLAKGGLQVTALHNHMLDTTPATYFVHWFGTGRATALATNLRTAFDSADYPKKG